MWSLCFFTFIFRFLFATFFLFGPGGWKQQQYQIVWLSSQSLALNIGSPFHVHVLSMQVWTNSYWNQSWPFKNVEKDVTLPTLWRSVYVYLYAAGGSTDYKISGFIHILALWIFWRMSVSRAIPWRQGSIVINKLLCKKMESHCQKNCL